MSTLAIIKNIKEKIITGIEVQCILSDISISYLELVAIEDALASVGDSMYEEDLK